MKNLWHSFLLAWMWFTRIPIPVRIQNVEKLQQQSLAWLGVVGLGVGSFGMGILVLAASWNPWISSLLATVSMALLTGALHEDGWADGWDALGAGGDASRRLAVLKDPRLGSFGVYAMLFTVALQVSCGAQLAVMGQLWVLPVVHAFSRMPLALLAWSIPYVRTQGEGKAGFLRESPGPKAWVLWTILLGVAVVPLFYLPSRGMWIAGTALAVSLLAVIPWKRLLGGVTGDVFGFCQQAGLLSGLLVATWGTL